MKIHPPDRPAALPDAILALALIALVFVTCLAVDQRNIIKCRDARIQELTLENVDLKQDDKK